MERVRDMIIIIIDTVTAKTARVVGLRHAPLPADIIYKEGPAQIVVSVLRLLVILLLLLLLLLRVAGLTRDHWPIPIHCMRWRVPNIGKSASQVVPCRM